MGTATFEGTYGSFLEGTLTLKGLGHEFYPQDGGFYSGHRIFKPHVVKFFGIPVGEKRTVVAEIISEPTIARYEYAFSPKFSRLEYKGLEISITSNEFRSALEDVEKELHAYGFE